MLRKISLLLTILFLLACSSMPRNANERRFSFSTIDEIDVNRATAIDVKSRLGEPNEQFYTDQKNVPRELVWLYFEKPFQSLARIAVFFDPTSNQVLRISWQVREDEPESALEYLKKYFRTDFYSEQGVSENPHYLSDEILYSSSQKSVVVSYLSSRNAVASISKYSNRSDAYVRSPNSVPQDSNYQIEN